MNGRALLPVAEAARLMGLSERRIRALISSGRVEASKQAGRWFVDRDSLDRWHGTKPTGGRPLNASNAWAVLLALAGRQADWLTPWDKSRLSYRLHLQSPQDWLPRLRRRASLNRLRGHPTIIEPLSQEPRVILSGVSAAHHYGADIAPRNELEAYVPADRLARLKQKYGLERSNRPNVLLRSIEQGWPFAKKDKVAPASAVAIDLLESDDERTRRAGAELWSRVIREAKGNVEHPEE